MSKVQARSKAAAGAGRSARPAVVVAVLLVYGIYSTLLGLVMIFAPGFFFDTVGGFSGRKWHAEIGRGSMPRVAC